MKQTILIVLISFLSLATFGQKGTGFVSMQSGVSLPVGQFRADDLDGGGFARAGFGISASGGWYFLEWLGVGAQAALNIHPVDVGALGYEKMQSDPFLQDLYIRSDPWRTYSGYAGVVVNREIHKGFSVTGKLLGGIIYAQSPYQLYKAEYFTVGANWYEITSAGDYEGSFLAGAGMRYWLKNNLIGFAFDGEFTYQEADFSFSTISGEIRTDRQVISYVSLMLGLNLRIGSVKPR
jgi:hypothetical protein